MSGSDWIGGLEEAILRIPEMPDVSGHVISMWLLGMALGVSMASYGHVPIGTDAFIWGMIGLVVFISIMEDVS